MSFNNLRLEELQKVAETFAVDHQTANNKADLVALLTEEGISFEMYEKFLNADKVDPELSPGVVKTAPEAPTDGQVLVKMERMNPRYDVNEFTFTKENPFIVMSEPKAQEIFDSQEGFRLATPKEVQEFYS
jgi:hypothetical protein